MSIMQSHNATIEFAYERLTEDAISTWNANGTIGLPTPFPYHRKRLALAIGRTFTASNRLRTLLNDMRTVSTYIPRLEVPETSWLHFTFLALSPHNFARVESFPDSLSVVKQSYTRCVAGRPWTIKNLRLVPLHNGLLLAGIPDMDTLASRKQLADDLLSSPWETMLRARYGRYPIPPVIWHTTLMRFPYERMPAPARDIYFAYSSGSFGDITLDPPILAAVSYNWSQVIRLLP